MLAVLLADDPVSIRETRQSVQVRFRRWAAHHSYASHAPGPLVPESDDSVLFTGAAISTWKPYLVDRVLPDQGFAIVQRCVRTQNARRLLSGELLEWSSWFHTFNTLDRLRSPAEVCRNVWSLLTEWFEIPPERLRIRIASSYSDLMEWWTGWESARYLEIDKLAPAQYTHRFGIPGVTGRNLNLAVVHPSTGCLDDFGNIIVIEREGQFCAIELACGLETMVARLAGFVSAIQATELADVVRPAKEVQIALTDAVNVSLELLAGGIRPFATNRGRVLRTYLQAVGPLAERAAASWSDLYPAIASHAASSGRAREAEFLARYVDLHMKLVSNGSLTVEQINRRLANALS